MSGDRQLPFCLSKILAVSWCFRQGKGAGVVGAFIEYFTPLQTLSNTTYMSAPMHVPVESTALELVTGNKQPAAASAPVSMCRHLTDLLWPHLHTALLSLLSHKKLPLLAMLKYCWVYSFI